MQQIDDSSRNTSENNITAVSENHFELWRKLVKDGSKDELEFLNIFNSAKDIEESYRSGWIDFSYHILKPDVLRLLGDPGECTALEIGYGAGRLICPASHYFKHCIGVDIHPLRDYVANLIAAKVGNEVVLHQNDGKTLPVEDKSIDLVYSFIVLQHLPNLDILKSYLQETKRILKNTGVAILYFGYQPRRLFKNYLEITDMEIKSARDVTLRVTMSFGRKLARESGLVVREASRSKKRPWTTEYGGQFFQILSPK